jgi:hypothetical protein
MIKFNTCLGASMAVGADEQIAFDLSVSEVNFATSEVNCC